MEHGKVEELEKKYGVDAKIIYEIVLKALK